MKIFYKKDYLEVKEEKEWLEKSYEKISNDFAKAISLIEEKNEEIKIKDNQLNLKENSISKLDRKVKELQGAKGGLTKRNNALLDTFGKLKGENKTLKEQVVELTKEIAELKVTRYKVTQLRSAVPRKSKLEMNIKSSSRKSNIMKNLK